ncbi:hypothetical protein BC936DRAFT_144927 [Jimgerdemannia flammicorona]|uniref:PH domain-containing protein n=1 Tax=Jimgerdemannia flammicorona TaxID=994334 RepID=A0A433DBB4_9FUNG|nr:hypothetical protein BC936DRAFT_144927 [Jimgerdemannia flammicorona]
MSDPDFANAVVRSFTDSLQASLAFKQKMVSDMEERMIAPTQLFIKTEMKEFKFGISFSASSAHDFGQETRKNYNKTLEKYESMLYRYNALSKTKEASALREDAFQLYEIRKSHIRVSAEYMLKITEFKAALEHMLVEQVSRMVKVFVREGSGRGCVKFVNGIQAEADYHEGSYEVYKSLRKPITQWRAWLGESKSTIDYQLSLLRASRKPLEEEAITLARPQRSLTNYNAPSSISLFASPTSNANAASPITKHGYLYQRTVTGKPARFVWSRRWFFVEDGWFGSLTVGTVGKVKGCVMLGERVGVLLCDVKQNSEQDRRFCFEVVCKESIYIYTPKCICYQPTEFILPLRASFLLQAETEDDLQEWMLTFESARRFIVENAQQPLDASNPTNIDTPTAATSSATTETRDESTEPPAAEVDKDGSDTAAGGSGSDSERRTKSARSSLGPNTSIADLTGGVPISPTHSPTTLNRPPSTGSSLAGMMIREAARQGTDLMYKASGGTNPSSSSIAGAWGSIPWTLVPGASLFINNQGNGEGEPGIFNSGGALVEGYSVDGGVVSLPTTTTGRDRSGSLSGASRPRSGSGGTGGLERLNSAVIGAGDDDLKVTEITGYPPDLDVRNKQLRRLFQSVEKDEVVLDAFLSALVQKPTDASKDVTSSSTSTSPAPPRSSYGYSYPGRSFLTQRALYFHSRVVMNCVNTVTLRLKDVISIKLVRDASPIPGGDVLLVFEISAPVGGSQEKEKLMLRVLMDDAELIMEKINMTAATAKADQSMKLQHLFEVLRSMRKGVSVYVAPTPAVTPPPTQKETKGTDEAKVVTEMLAPATKKESDAEKQKEASGGPPAGESSKASEEKQKEQATPVDGAFPS